MIANYIPPADPMELLVRDVDSNGPLLISRYGLPADAAAAGE